MVMRDIGSFHCPKPRFISRGGARGNEYCLYPEITILKLFYCTDTIHLCPFINTC